VAEVRNSAFLPPRRGQHRHSLTAIDIPDEHLEESDIQFFSAVAQSPRGSTTLRRVHFVMFLPAGILRGNFRRE